MGKRRGSILADVTLGIVITMVLIAAGSYGFSNYLNTGKTARATAEVSRISTAISRYHYEMRSYPVNLAALTTTKGGFGPWLTEIPATDPWGKNAYHYYFTTNRFAVWSNGVNGVNNSGTTPSIIAGDDVGVVSQ